MSGEPKLQDDNAVRGGAVRHISTLTHLDATGTGAGRNSPLRWLAVIVPVLLIALGGAYLLSQWAASLLEMAEPLRIREQRPAEKAQRPAIPEKAQRRGPTESSGVDARESDFDVAVVLRLLPQADPGAGASIFKMCAACHTDEKGGAHKVGNNLWNIVGSPKAARPDYRYSQALRAKGGAWTYRELAHYLHNPRTSVPGTSMAFFGIIDNQRMANLLAYMRTRADRPVPLPN